ncbi:MAG TPA: indolepyruvate ferredoxin oxidoreductase family protein, partial [Usitatibacter sp.]|nr:indolepyruvate ferredoxin oxidoreductase family protein [Usitatibacter sp.]
VRDLAPGTAVHHRDELDAVQRALREIPGTTVLVYDQTCAAEKRRRRKRGKFPDPQKRVVINDLVCEGCGDCSVKSNCLSVVPLETEFGRKRAIDQSTCNKDYSCLKGFCPSFITVEGGQLRKKKSVVQEVLAPLPMPPLPQLDRPYGILVTGIGGTGVVTIGAILGMAAHLEGKGATVLDMAGLAQKGGSVYSHIRIAPKPEQIHAVRIAAGDARLVLGCDMIVAASDEAIAKMQSGSTRAVINGDVAPTGDFTKQPDLQVPANDMAESIRVACGGAADFVDATDLATALMGDSIATNLFMVGYAWQKALIPLNETSILQAIELNGAAVESNKKAFEWGRRAAVDLASVERAATPPEARPESQRLSQSLDEVIGRRMAFLAQYQDEAYARRYGEFVQKTRVAENSCVPGSTQLTSMVARYLFKLMAYKDEYEVARLHADTGFLKRIAAQFEGEYTVKMHLAPPLWARPDPVTGEATKREFGPWMMRAMGVLARFKGLRGTPFDVFGYSRERRTERQLIADYRKTIEELLADLEAGRIQLAAEIAAIPEFIRGYGHVKDRHLKEAKSREAALLDQWRDPEKSEKPRIPIAVAA